MTLPSGVIEFAADPGSVTLSGSITSVTGSDGSVITCPDPAKRYSLTQLDDGRYVFDPGAASELLLPTSCVPGTDQVWSAYVVARRPADLIEWSPRPAGQGASEAVARFEGLVYTETETPVTAATAGGGGGSSDMTLFSNIYADAIEGGLCEFGFYPRCLTTGERDLLRAYLAAG